MIKTNVVMFASDDTPDAVNDARAYIKAQGFTKLDVKLVQRDGQTLVVSIRELWK